MQTVAISCITPDFGPGRRRGRGTVSSWDEELTELRKGQNLSHPTLDALGCRARGTTGRQDGGLCSSAPHPWTSLVADRRRRALPRRKRNPGVGRFLPVQGMPCWLPSRQAETRPVRFNSCGRRACRAFVMSSVEQRLQRRPGDSQPNYRRRIQTSEEGISSKPLLHWRQRMDSQMSHLMRWATNRPSLIDPEKSSPESSGQCCGAK